MTSLLGKWKLCLLLFVLGSSAFAKAETYPATMLCNNFSITNTQTYTLDLTVDRDQIFSLFKDLKAHYGISCSINAYRRKSGVTSKLGIELVSSTGVVYHVFEEDHKGIKDICLEIDKVTKEVIYFDHCDVKKDSSIATHTTVINRQQIGDEKFKNTSANLKSAQENPTEINGRESVLLKDQINKAKKEKQALKSQIAQARSEKLKEEKRLALLQQKERLAATVIKVRERKAQAAAAALELRKRKQEELQAQQMQQKREKEAARIVKLEEERLRIIKETEELRRTNLIEQERLLKIKEDREAAQRLSDLKNENLKESKESLAQMKQARKLDYREERATSKALEKQRLTAEELKKQEIKLANEELDAVRRNQEEELEKLEYEKTKALEISKKLKEQEMVKELDRIQRERDLAEKTLNVINENYKDRLAGLQNLETLMKENTELIIEEDSTEKPIAEGTLIFKAEQCFYTVYSDRTVIYNTMGRELLTLDLPYEEELIMGKVFYKKKSRNYKFNGNVLIIENIEGAAKQLSFRTNKTYIITSQYTAQQFENLVKNLVESGHDFSNLEYKTLVGNNSIYKLSFKINNENYSFEDSQGITDIELIDNVKEGKVFIRKAS
ncbi:hypothetical protein [Nonlabens sp. Asnod3-A02]|uniref:hypothetical protein n=1 Tax=Nonlabens sp. Asnod3-A02 TaxID=3160579 RepID=UPI00386BEDD4